MIKLGISGFCGKMGQRIFTLAKADKGFKVILGLENAGHPQIGKILEGIKVIDNPQEIKNCDCLIDFTVPLATVEHLSYLVKFKKCAVIGTTGLDKAQQLKIKEAAKKIPIVFAPNMSIGVNVLFKLVQMAARTLKNYGIYLEEAHHIHKKDAPSGTAKEIARIINTEGFDIKIENIKSIREDEIVGDHKIIFESDVDKIELFHSAKTRDIFAKGAISAAKWVANKKSGLYSMADVLGLKSKVRS